MAMLERASYKQLQLGRRYPLYSDINIKPRCTQLQYVYKNKCIIDWNQ
jgi:hypothetical protein